MGHLTTASGSQSTAMGRSTTASGSQSTALGRDTTASGGISTAMGHLTTASGSQSTAMGRFTTASGDISTAMGHYTTASGNASTAMGHQTHAGSYGETSIGLFADDTVGDLSASVLTDVLFEIGNGTATNARSNAMTVLKNGNVGIGTSTPQATLDVNGSALIGEFTFGADAANIDMAYEYESIGLNHSGTRNFRIQSPNSIYFHTDMASTGEPSDNSKNRMAIRKNGNIGIGTISPGAKLDVAGGIK